MERTGLYNESKDSEVPILARVNQLLNSPFKEEVDKKVSEFQRFMRSPKEEIFGELCFCILTANTSAEMGIKTQETIGLNGFLEYGEARLRDELKAARYRFYNLRSRFIVNSRWIIDELPDLINSPDSFSTREYLVENILGIGYKEASHFLRNVGVFDFAILDKHIVRMVRRGTKGKEFKPSSRKGYLETEKIILEMASDIGLQPGILDLYMWKLATGKLIK